MQNYIVIVPAYNVEDWIAHCLGSIMIQKNFKNSKVVVIDDCSTDNTWDIIQKYPFIAHRNKVHNGSCIQNMIKALSIAKPDTEDVIMVLDGDDWFADSEVFTTLDEVYKEYVWFTYGQYEPVSGTYKNFCKPILNSDTYRKEEVWTIGQLRTWKTWLWNLVWKDDLQRDGKYLTCSGDRAFSYPMIEMAGTHIRLIEKVLYIYNDFNPLNEFRLIPEEAEEMAQYIISKKPYKRL